ncbi:MAG: MBL fold metallo-hydrolase [Clostridiales bacterium]|nr:MBL fold metallo-hydrolase [Clostridiales bacterium]
MAKVCQLFSGSSGNSIYIGTNNGGILVDIGVSAKRCEAALRGLGIQPESIKAVLVTHEHRDHIAGLRVFAARYKTPVFASPATMEEMRFTGIVNNTVSSYELNSVLDLGDMFAESFHNSHDAAECVGYKISIAGGRIVSVCTDTGYVTDEAKNAVSGSDLVFLESNHEVSMLQNGGYPYPLKRRILSNQGHLSNEDASQFAKELLQSGTTRFVLSHLSRENNIPEIARQYAVNAFNEIGAKENSDYRLYVSKPVNDRGFIIL